MRFEVVLLGGLLYWVLAKSGGEMQFDTEHGTSVRLEFPATQPPDAG
jgi:hypothetical protein